MKMTVGEVNVNWYLLLQGGGYRKIIDLYSVTVEDGHIFLVGLGISDITNVATPPDNLITYKGDYDMDPSEEKVLGYEIEWDTFEPDLKEYTIHMEGEE